MEYWAAVVNIIIPNLHTDERYEGYLVQRQKRDKSKNNSKYDREVYTIINCH